MPRHLVILELERRYFQSDRPKRIICTSKREVDDIANVYGVDPTLTVVLPNPFDPRLFNAERRRISGDEAHAALTFADDQLAVVFVANELHRKGLATLLTALAGLGDDRIVLNIIGRTSVASYQPLIDRLGLGQRVRYHGPQNDVGWWYSGADLLVLPTQYEPFGLVIVEALASGVPVITTKLAGASEAVTPHVTGLIQDDPHDVEELTSLLRVATQADLELWSRRAAASVKPYERGVVLPKVEEILLGT